MHTDRFSLLLRNLIGANTYFLLVESSQLAELNTDILYNNY